MIKASEARKATKEAEETKEKQLHLRNSRELEQKLKTRIADTDNAIKAAMKRAEYDVILYWDHTYLPPALKEDFKTLVISFGFSVRIVPDDDGDGWEVLISWRE